MNAENVECKLAEPAEDGVPTVSVGKRHRPLVVCTGLGGP